jgi:hypothetical protein
MTQADTTQRLRLTQYFWFYDERRWMKSTSISDSIMNALKSAADTVISGVMDIFSGLGTAILNAIKRAIPFIWTPKEGPGSDKSQDGGMMFGGAKQNQSYTPPPSKGGSGGAIQIHNYIDGSRVQGHIIKTIVRDSQAIHGSVDHDGVGGAPHPASFRI